MSYRKLRTSNISVGNSEAARKILRDRGFKKDEDSSGPGSLTVLVSQKRFYISGTPEQYQCSMENLAMALDIHMFALNEIKTLETKKRLDLIKGDIEEMVTVTNRLSQRLFSFENNNNPIMHKASTILVESIDKFNKVRNLLEDEKQFYSDWIKE